MAVVPFKNSPEYIKGKIGEDIVVDFMKSRGWLIIPSYDYCGESNNKPPRLIGKFKEFAIPDIDASRNGTRIWVEVKTKASYDETWIGCDGNKLKEHGIPKRLFDHYMQVEKESGTDIYLVIYEIKTGCLLRGKLSKLDIIKRVSLSKKMDRSGMVFFERRYFQLLTTIECNLT